MIRKLGLIGMLIWTQWAMAQGYRLEVDLTNCRNDQVRVRLYTPSIMEDEVEYLMPAIVPGTYARYDFGRFISKLRAYDSRGRKLPVKRKDNNHFIIRKATRLAYLEYWVSDTWDQNKDPNYIFQPAGLNFEAGKCFALNFFGLAGYLRGRELYPYRVVIQHPENLLGSCALKGVRGAQTDGWEAESYHHLADAPALYAKPDTTSFRVGKSSIQVAVQSPIETLDARFVARALKPIATALKDFFETLPVDRYVFLMHFDNVQDIQYNPNGGTGALEHNYSSFYYLSASNDSNSNRHLVRDVATHEFLHILTPLNIHSREIEHFDYENPKMSQHLWMYEGVTEYFSQLIQERSGLITQKKFLEVMRDKIINSREYPSVSFTEMSKLILTDQYKNHFLNVYEKGAVLAFLLDIRLNELSNGKMSLRELMMTLAKKYGPNRAFEDESLIQEIVTMTDTSIGDFFSRYVQGSDSLPLTPFFHKIGWDYFDEKSDSTLSYGRFGFSYQEGKENIEVVNTEASENALGIQTGDLLIGLNGKEIDAGNLSILDKILSPKAGDSCSLEIKRNGKTMVMMASPSLRIQTKQCVLKPSETVTEEQLRLREWVLD
jgi:predicted metalloprotease with PDZ domain